ncbi:TPA: transcriptional regulator FeaR [Pseudomonas aeruginosa]|nr:transcriptional regulator FeaR [Pseudomonas aeruginosa]
MHTYSTNQSALENWNHSIQMLCGTYETQLAYNSSLFIGNASAQEHAGLVMARLKTNAGQIKRLPKSDRDDDRFCFLVSQRSGRSRIVQGGVTLDLSPGDLVLMDSVGDCEILPQGLIEHTSLCLPRSSVLKSLGASRQLSGLVSSHSASGRMLRTLVDQLYVADGYNTVDREEAEAMITAITGLLSPALKELDSAAVFTGSTPSNNLYRHAQHLIDEMLGYPNLSPVLLAKKLNISVRHLYRLFEEEGERVSQYIQRNRLKRSASDLCNLHLQQESITSIAFKWGFTDSAHFSRAFKKQFEQSPRDYRCTMLRPARLRT